MGETLQSGVARNATLIAVLLAVLAVVAFGLPSLLPHTPDADDHVDRSPRELVAAYAHVIPGRTRASQLAAAGFDTQAPNVEVLSYLAVVERFMPRDSVKYDQLSGAMRNCLEARDRCTALVFKPARTAVRSAGMLSMFDFHPAAPATPVAVTLLLQNGRVAYKTIEGVGQAPHRPVAAGAVTASAMPAVLRTANY